MPRFFTPRPSQEFLQGRLNPIGPSRRLDESAPVAMAYLGGEPVFLARPDPRTRRAGMPADLTVPLTARRMRRELDIASGRDPGPTDRAMIENLPRHPGASGLGAAAVGKGYAEVAIGFVLGFLAVRVLFP